MSRATTQPSESSRNGRLRGRGQQRVPCLLSFVLCLNVYEEFCLHLCTGTTRVQCSKEPDRVLDALAWDCEPPCVCWKENFGPSARATST